MRRALPFWFSTCRYEPDQSATARMPAVAAMAVASRVISWSVSRRPPRRSLVSRPSATGSDAIIRATAPITRRPATKSIRLLDVGGRAAAVEATASGRDEGDGRSSVTNGGGSTSRWTADEPGATNGRADASVRSPGTSPKAMAKQSRPAAQTPRSDRFVIFPMRAPVRAQPSEPFTKQQIQQKSPLDDRRVFGSLTTRRPACELEIGEPFLP